MEHTILSNVRRIHNLIRNLRSQSSVTTAIHDPRWDLWWVFSRYHDVFIAACMHLLRFSIRFCFAYLYCVVSVAAAGINGRGTRHGLSDVELVVPFFSSPFFPVPYSFMRWNKEKKLLVTLITLCIRWSNFSSKSIISYSVKSKKTKKRKTKIAVGLNRCTEERWKLITFTEIIAWFMLRVIPLSLSLWKTILKLVYTRAGVNHWSPTYDLEHV